MNKNIDKNNLNDVINISKKLLKLFYLILIVVGAYLILKVAKELNIIGFIVIILKVLSPLFIGIVVAWLLNPFVKWLESKNVRRSIGTTLSYVILVSILYLIIKSIIPLLYNQTIDLVSNFPNIFSSLKDWLENVFSNFNSNAINIDNIEKTMFDRLDVFSNNLATSLPELIINFLTSVISSIGTFLVGLVIGFFLLLSCSNLSNTLLEFIPKRFVKTTTELANKINISLRNYVNGAALDAFIVFVVCTIVFAIIGLKYPLLFGLFCGITNVIPYIGPYIGGIPAVIVAFSQSPAIGIAILVSIALIQTIEGNVLQTLIISKTTKLHPVVIIVGLLIFGHFFGILGMLLSTPIIGVAKVIIVYLNDKYDLFNFN